MVTAKDLEDPDPNGSSREDIPPLRFRYLSIDVFLCLFFLLHVSSLASEQACEIRTPGTLEG